MKTLRVWLVVLLALVLPLRGVLAAGMPCTLGGQGGVPMSVPSVAQMDQQFDADQEVTADAQTPPSDVDDQKLDVSDADGQPDETTLPMSDCGSCTTCGLCYLTAGLVSASYGAPSQRLAAVAFPSYAAAAPSFISGALERPPRTI